jgi:hypothetical protein
MVRLQRLMAAGLVGTMALVGCSDEGPTGVSASRSGQPGRVNDLAASAVTDTSVTLVFTAVDDGTGEPARYDVHMGTTTVSRGSCRSPVIGAAVGAAQSCTVTGLAPATTYDFDVVARREDATAGPRSNVAQVRTAERGAAAVARVEVAPANASFVAGETGQFTATARSSAGTPLAYRPIAWRSSDTAIAVVSNTGVVTARRAGTATITATTDGQQGSASVSVAGAPPSGGWSNQPAGFTTISDKSFNSIVSGGWNQAYNAAGLMSVASDPQAPHSASSTLRFTYPAGFVGGAAPAMAYRGLPTRDRIYVGTWWRANAEWEGHPTSVNKIQYLFTNSQGSVFMNLYGAPGGPYELRVFPQFNTSNGEWLRPNITNIPVTMGDWHRIEWLVEYTGGGQGRIRWWLDGTLLGDHQNLAFPTERLAELKLSPVWGGAGGVKTRTDHVWYDHVLISGS